MRLPSLRRAAAFTWALLWLASADAGAASVLPLDLDQLVDRARDVVHVRCVGNDTRADPLVHAATVTTFVVLERAKGAGGSTFEIRQAGGEFGGLAIDYHVPKFRVGDEYVLFVPEPSRTGLASPVGLAQGVFGVTPGAAGKLVGNGRDFAELLPGAAPADLPPGIRARLAGDRDARKRVDLAEFMTLVRSKAR